MDIKIYYFSGTGNTEMTSTWLKGALEAKDASVELLKIEDAVKKGDMISFDDAGVVGIGAPVYSFNMAEIVFKFLRLLSVGNGKKCFVFSTSGGYSKYNFTSVTKVADKLNYMGYDVFHEMNYVMPTNFAQCRDEKLERDLCRATEENCVFMADEIVSLKVRKLKRSVPAAVFAVLGKSEVLGAKLFGKTLKVNDSCIKCGKCARECPSGNITFENSEVKFGSKCIWCMRCVFSCPAKAIYSNIFKFTYSGFKDGYSIKRIVDSIGDEKVVSNDKYKVFLRYVNHDDIK